MPDAKDLSLREWRAGNRTDSRDDLIMWQLYHNLRLPCQQWLAVAIAFNAATASWPPAMWAGSACGRQL